MGLEKKEGIELLDGSWDYYEKAEEAFVDDYFDPPKKHWLSLCLDRPEKAWDDAITLAVMNSDPRHPNHSFSRTKFFKLRRGCIPLWFTRRPRLALAFLLIHWSRKTGRSPAEEHRIVFWGLIDAGFEPPHDDECTKTLADILEHARERYVDFTKQPSKGRPDKLHLRAQMLLHLVISIGGPHVFTTALAVNELSFTETVTNWRSFQAIVGRLLSSCVTEGWLINPSRNRWQFIVDEIPDHKNPSRELQRQHRTRGHQ